MFRSHSSGRTFSLSDVLYVENLSTSLVSCAQLSVTHEASVQINGPLVKILDKTGQKVVCARRDQSKLYRLEAVTLSEQESAFVLKISQTTKTWHRRLGHPGSTAMQSTVPLVSGLSSLTGEPVGIYDSCAIGKSHRLPYQSSTSRSEVPGEYLHSDVYTLSKTSFDGYKYLVLFIDDATSFTFGQLLRSKRPDELLSFFKPLSAFIKRQTGTDIKRLRSDGGTEYGGHFESFCVQQGISMERTVPHNPQQNGKAERMNRTLNEPVECMIHYGNLPAELEGHCYGEDFNGFRDYKLLRLDTHAIIHARNVKFDENWLENTYRQRPQIQFQCDDDHSETPLSATSRLPAP